MNPCAVVDTNVLSYVLLGSTHGDDYRAILRGYVAGVACVTPEELYFGAERRKWGERRRAALQALIDACILLPVNLEVAQISARLRAERERAGKPIDRADAWIAATALWHCAPLCTHDRDFDGIPGLEIITLLDEPVEAKARVSRPRPMTVTITHKDNGDIDVE